MNLTDSPALSRRQLSLETTCNAGLLPFNAGNKRGGSGLDFIFSDQQNNRVEPAEGIDRFKASL